MSYILDALKKSEQERSHGAIPGVQTVHSSSINYHQEKSSIWPWLLVALIAINLAAVIYYIQSGSARQDDAGDYALASEEISPIDNFAESLSKQNIAVTPPPSTPVKEIATTVTPQKLQQETYITPEPRTVDLYDLPLSVRQYIPEMKFSAHVYSSNPLQRSLVINNRFMEEGSQVNDDLLLSEITSDGAIFEFQGYRFSTSVLSGWD